MLTLDAVKNALLDDSIDISPHAEMRKFERGIPLNSVLAALPYSCTYSRTVADKHDPKATRLCINVNLKRATYTLVFGDAFQGITLITEYCDSLHQSHDDDHYSLVDGFRRAGR